MAIIKPPFREKNGPFGMENISWIEAYNHLVTAFSKLKPRIKLVPLQEAIGQRIASDLVSPAPYPDTARSLMDGFALRRSDVIANKIVPHQFHCLGEIAPGETPPPNLLPINSCYAVQTGAALPAGADAVLMLEEVFVGKSLHSTDRNLRARIDSAHQIRFDKLPAPNEHMVRAGDDIVRGELLLARGTRLEPKHVAALAGCGCTQIPIFDSPRVAIFSTGMELISSNCQELPLGKIRDSNTPMLQALWKAEQAEVKRMAILSESGEPLRQALLETLPICDLVFVSGGSSVGPQDDTAEVFASLPEVQPIFRGIAMKPGKPTILCTIGDKTIIGLPGHPLSALVVAKRIRDAFVDARYGSQNHSRTSIAAELACDIPSPAGREEIRFAKFEQEGAKLIAHPMDTRSSFIGTTLRACGYFVIPAEVELLRAGSIVDIWTERD